MPYFEIHPVLNLGAFIAPFVCFALLKSMLSVRVSLLPLAFIPIGVMCLYAGRVSILYGEILDTSHAQGAGIVYIIFGLIYCLSLAKNIKKRQHR